MVKNLKEIPDIPFNPAVKAWKEQGKKVVGFLCSFVPEEIIYAADILPYRVRATGCNRTTQADLWMSNFTCSFARSCLEFAMDGSYDFLDGLVGLDSCAMIHKLYDNWRIGTNPSFSHFLTVPHKNGDSAILWYRDEIEALKQAVQEHFGTEIRRESLEKAIEIYNETRRLLRELYELRKSQALPITGSETQSLVLAAMSMPREQYNEILRRSLEEIKAREPITDYRVRLMVIGSALDDPAFIKIIEDQGGIVVTDSLCFGNRYFRESVEIREDLLASLARSYLCGPRCPRMMEQHALIFEFIKDMVQTYKVDGIIYQKMQFCDLWGGESLYLENKLKESKIPFLSFQREHIVTHAGQIATRVEAFIEMIDGVIE